MKRVKGERQMKELNLTSAAIKLKYDGKVTISTGRSRKDKKWKSSEPLWSQLVGRLSETHRTYESREEYRSCSKEMRAGLKDLESSMESRKLIYE
jgi:hypothetical protein